MLTVIYL